MFLLLLRFISVLIFCPESWHSDGVVCPRPSWLGGTLLARLARWCVASRKRAFKDTLSLVCVAKYSRTHQALREKHGALVKVRPACGLLSLTVGSCL